MMTWTELVSLPEHELACRDLVEVVCACAAGLPGAEAFDVDACRQTVDQWARHAVAHLKQVTSEYHHNPAAYDHSWNLFRVVDLLTVLQHGHGIRYDPELIDRDDFFTDARNLFLPGVLASRKGTCSSLPQLYLAVGRRLGYPLKLVTAKSHFFLRWDDTQGERFNIECTSRGLNSHPDDY